MISRLIIAALIAISAHALASAQVLAETVTVTYTEPDETALGNLAYCTVHRCFGAVCTDWQPIKRIPATSVNGGTEVVTQVNIDLQISELPRAVRFGVSCTDTSGNEGSILATTGGATGNPITFTAP